MAARTKKRVAEQAPADPTPEAGAVAPADDRTAIDDIEARKQTGTAEQLPEGFKKRLPGSVTRKIKVIKKELDKPEGKPIRIAEPDGTATDYDEAIIEGPSRLRRTEEVVNGCTVGASIHIETDSPIVLGSGRKALAEYRTRGSHMSKLAFREDKKAGVVRVFFSSLDDTDRTEVATMSLALLEKIPGLFKKWVAVMQDAYKVALEEATGAVVKGFHEYRPHDKN